MNGPKLPVASSDEWRKIAQKSSLAARRDQSMPEVVLLIDTSGSMDGSALAQAREGALGFARKAIEDGWAVGLIRFSDRSDFACKPTRDLEILKKSLPWVASGGTAMHNAITEALDHLETVRRRRAICIVSDGIPDDKSAAVNAAQRAKRLAVEVIVIGVDGADIAFLAQLATRRELSRRTSIAALPNTMEDAARLLPSLRALPKA